MFDKEAFMAKFHITPEMIAKAESWPGKRTPKPKVKREPAIKLRQVKIPDDLYQGLAREAATQRCSATALLRRILAERYVKTE